MRVPAGLLLGTLGALAIFGRLGCPLLEPEEARYAEIPRQMLAEGRFIVPVWHGQPYLHKPPLLYWLVMACYALFGVNDVAARLIPCFAAWLTLLAIYVWTARRTGRDVAAWTGLLLCFTAGFIYRGPMLSMDSLLMLFVVVGLWCAHEALTLPAQARRAQVCWLLSAVCCGLGVLTKGPVAAVLIVVPISLYRLLVHIGKARQAGDRVALASCRAVLWPDRGPPAASTALYLAVTCMVAAPWYLAVAWREPGALWDFLWLHNAQRFAIPFDHAEPFWFYAPVVLGGLLPASLLLPWLLVRAVRNLATRGGSMAPSASLLAGIGGILCVLFFSLSGCKRAGYVLPALPLLVMVIGRHASDWLRRFSPGKIGLRPAVTLLVVLCGVELFAVLGFLRAYHERFSMRSEVRAHGQAARRPAVRVACYPRGWDSVHFYLDRAAVRIFTRADSAKLAATLHGDGPLVLFVKAAHLHEVRDLLPAHHELHWSPGRNVAVVSLTPAPALAATR
ncbi:MAG: phospholipid carrier-dependent glycosyltransferase [Planctomycetes bacterium]|nr:phospholipid carrier-dependent glycosyltransferase [Planctomycetota bacterium]